MCPHKGFCAVSLCKDALVFIPAKPVYYGYSNQQNAPQKTAVLCDTGKGEFIMARVYNFSAGPSMLPEKVLKQAQAELLEYGDSGQSVMEMSHRSKWFDAIIKDTEATLRRVMNIPDNYKVGFFQGGATQQFAMVPLNFMTTGKADYLVTGNFSNHAAKEAAKITEETHTWYGWKELGYEVIHESKCLYQAVLSDPATKSGTRRTSYFGLSQVQLIEA